MGFLDWFMKNEMPKGTFQPVNPSEFTSTNASGVTAKVIGVIPPTAPRLDIVGGIKDYAQQELISMVTIYAITKGFSLLKVIGTSSAIKKTLYFFGSRLGTRFKQLFGFGTTATTIHETSIDQKVFDKLFTPIIRPIDIQFPPEATGTERVLAIIKGAAAPVIGGPAPFPAVQPVNVTVQAPVESPVVEATRAVVSTVSDSVFTFNNILTATCVVVAVGMFSYYLWQSGWLANYLNGLGNKDMDLEALASTPVKPGIYIHNPYLKINTFVPRDLVERLGSTERQNININMFTVSADGKTATGLIPDIFDSLDSKSGIIDQTYIDISSLTVKQKAELVKEVKGSGSLSPQNTGEMEVPLLPKELLQPEKVVTKVTTSSGEIVSDVVQRIGEGMYFIPPGGM